MNQSYASCFDIFEAGFAFFYCMWGVNFLFAIALPKTSAQLVGIAHCLLSFLFSGVKPPAQELMEGLDGYMLFTLLLSPIRWGLSFLAKAHMVGPGGIWHNEAVRTGFDGTLSGRGYSLLKLQCPSSMPAAERWADSNGLVCSTVQLYLLGILFRVLSAIALLCLSSAKSAGGQLPLGAPSIAKSRIMRDCLMVFVGSAMILGAALLGRTTY